MIRDGVGHGCLDESRTNAVDPDVELGQLLGRRPGEPDNSGLRR